jgi:uncharacterized protein YdaU (DUF1376 family)
MMPSIPATSNRQWQSRLAMSRLLFSRGLCSHVSSKQNTIWIESGLNEHCSRSEKKAPAKEAAGSSARATLWDRRRAATNGQPISLEMQQVPLHFDAKINSID